MQVVNTDTAYYLQKTPDKIMAVAERDKNHKCLHSYLNQWRHFTLFVIYIDRMLGTETEAILKRLYSRLATKWRQPYSQTRGYV